MKLTKSKLKQIIMEEIRSIVEEEGHPDQSCDEAHSNQSHEEWEASQKTS